MTADGVTPIDLVCPSCRGRTERRANDYVCIACGDSHPIVEGIPLLFNPDDRERYRASRNTPQEYYRNVPEVYAETHHVGGAGARQFLTDFEARLEPRLKPGAKVLEIGAGTGFGTSVVHRYATDLTAADASWEMLALNRRAHPSVPMFCCTTENLPFPDESFDVVIGNNTFYLVPDKQEGARSIARVLKKGGCLILSEMNPYFPLWPLSFATRSAFFEASIYQIFPWQMGPRFEKVGMKLREVDFYSHVPYFAGPATQRLTLALGRVLGGARLTRRFATIRVWYVLQKGN